MDFGVNILVKEKLVIKVKDHNLPMTKEELENYMKMKRSFNGSFKNKKKYDRNRMKRSQY